MGFNFAAAGYGSAVEMHAALTRGGLPAHLACGIAFMRSKGLLKLLGAHDWKAFAKGYNGTAYRKNEYDTKLAAGYATWTAQLRAAPVEQHVSADPTVLKLGDANPRVKALQEALVAFGVTVKVDGIFGPKMRRAVAGAQVELGMTGDGVATPEFVTKLESAPRISEGARETATKKEVKQASFAARIGDRFRKGGGLGLGDLGVYQGYAATAQSTVDQVKGGIDSAKATRDSVVAIVGDGVGATIAAWAVEHWLAIAAAGACATVMVIGGSLLGSQIRAYRAGRLVA